jgi:rod shape-determining protein MreC
LVKPRGALLRENARLRREVRRMHRENSLLREAAAENTRLRRALDLRQASAMHMVAAEIVSRRASSWFDTATLNRGRNAHIETGAAVISESGLLVGQILEVNRFTSQVGALTEQQCGIGAMIRRSRHSGLLEGTDSDYLALTHLPKDADVRVNDLVISSGMGRVIPQGFPIGRVERVVRDRSAGTTSAWVVPSARLDKIEQVFIINPGQGATE